MKKLDQGIKLKSIKKKTLSDMVVDEIINLLTTGRIKGGDKLPSELELVEMLDVSRSVLREALISLETLGVIERRTKEGTFVSHKIGTRPYKLMLSLAATDITNLMETRMAQELGFVTLAAEKITDTELKSLKWTIDAMRNSDDNYEELDKEFHKIIASSASNHITEGIIDPLMTFFYQTYMNISPEHRNRTYTIEQHTAIYKALKNRDPIAAHKAMYEHLDFVRKRIRLTMENKKSN